MRNRKGHFVVNARDYIASGKDEWKPPENVRNAGVLLGTAPNGTKYRLVGQEVLRVSITCVTFVGTKAAFDRKVQRGAIELVPPEVSEDQGK